jgi:hypothetical protein
MAPTGPESDLAIRAIIVFLKSPFGGAKSAKAIHEQLFLSAEPSQSLSISQINRIYKRACDNGFNPLSPNIIIKDEWLEDKVRAGRPQKSASNEVKAAVEKLIITNRSTREKTCADIAYLISTELGISLSPPTIWRTLKLLKFKKTKPTRKPGLTKKMRIARFNFAKAHEHWTLEDWKCVIWTDETAVVIGHRRGGWRLWRRKDEAYVYSAIRPRWAGYMEFMFWGCFSYDKKGPYHIWKSETAAQKKAAEITIATLNTEREPELKEEWELNTAMSRAGLRNKPGIKPTWQFNKKSGKLVREKGKGGIDWWRYQQEIIVPKLIPFAKECMVERPNTLVQEDGAPSHAHHAQERVYKFARVAHLLWPGNSPDLNAIEPAWFWMKKNTTKNGPAEKKVQAEERWIEWWDRLPQTQIQAWIERIPHHITEIIRLNGGNEYKEGRTKVFDRREGMREEVRDLIDRSSSEEDSEIEWESDDD